MKARGREKQTERERERERERKREKERARTREREGTRERETCVYCGSKPHGHHVFPSVNAFVLEHA